MSYNGNSPEAAVGARAELMVKRWAKANGYFVLQVSNCRNGAAMYEGANGKVIAADLLLLDIKNGSGARTVEVKWKKGAYTYQKEKSMRTGVDRRCFEHMRWIRRSGLPVDLALIHAMKHRAEKVLSPKLFWAPIERLAECVILTEPSDKFRTGAALWNVNLDTGIPDGFEDLGFVFSDIELPWDMTQLNLYPWERPDKQGVLRRPDRCPMHRVNPTDEAAPAAAE